MADTISACISCYPLKDRETRGGKSKAVVDNEYQYARKASLSNQRSGPNEGKSSDVSCHCNLGMKTHARGFEKIAYFDARLNI